jgi:hypothetical protein
MKPGDRRGTRLAWTDRMRGLDEAGALMPIGSRTPDSGSDLRATDWRAEAARAEDWGRDSDWDSRAGQAAARVAAAAGSDHAECPRQFPARGLSPASARVLARERYPDREPAFPAQAPAALQIAIRAAPGIHAWRHRDSRRPKALTEKHQKLSVSQVTPFLKTARLFTPSFWHLAMQVTHRIRKLLIWQGDHARFQTALRILYRPFVPAALPR